jgi:hypothetical protein
MGIDIYARWERNLSAEVIEEVKAWWSGHADDVAYLREGYHGGPYATRHLVPEVFDIESGRAFISAALLRERLPETLRLAEEREREVYGETDAETIERVLQDYRDFVELCERAENETGWPVEIVASY